MLPSRLPPLAPFLLRFLLVAAAAAVPLACSNKAKDAAPSGATGPAAPQYTGELAKPVAKVDDTVITIGEVQDRMNKQASFMRSRYAGLDKRKDFLDNLIKFEVMAKEAERRGYDKDPEVVRATKQQAISKYMQKEFDSKLKVEDVPDADVEKYYREHPEEFNHPDEVRVSQILVKDKAKADKVAAEARAANKADPKPFRDLVEKYSEDTDSKPRGGDLTSFDKKSTLYPAPIVEAAFALKEVGDVSAPVKTDKGFHILRLTQKRPGFSRPISEVKRQIQQRLFRDVRTKALDALIADLKKKYNVTIDDANLAKVQVEPSTDMHVPASLAAPPGMSGPGMTPAMPSGAPGGPGFGPGHPLPPHMGGAPPPMRAEGKAP